MLLNKTPGEAVIDSHRPWPADYELSTKSLSSFGGNLWASVGHGGAYISTQIR